jgi:hypothetical protein
MTIDDRAELIGETMLRIAADRPSWSVEREHSDDMLEAWIEDLEGIPNDYVVAAALIYRRSTDEWPMAGKVREIAEKMLATLNGCLEPQPMEAWHQVYAYARTNREVQPQHIHPAALLAVEWCGGWARFHGIKVDQLDAFMGRFLDAYAQALEKLRFEKIMRPALERQRARRKKAQEAAKGADSGQN